MEDWLEQWHKKVLASPRFHNRRVRNKCHSFPRHWDNNRSSTQMVQAQHVHNKQAFENNRWLQLTASWCLVLTGNTDNDNDSDNGNGNGNDNDNKMIITMIMTITMTMTIMMMITMIMMIVIVMMVVIMMMIMVMIMIMIPLLANSRRKEIVDRSDGQW